MAQQTTSKPSAKTSTTSSTRKMPPVVPVIPRQLSKRQSVKPASLANNTQRTLPVRPSAKEKTFSSESANPASPALPEYSGPLIAATPKPDPIVHDVSSSERQNSTSSTSDLSMSLSTSRRDTPISALSDYGSVANSSKTPSKASRIGPSTSHTPTYPDHNQPFHTLAEGSTNINGHAAHSSVVHSPDLDTPNGMEPPHHATATEDPAPSISTNRPLIWPRISSIEPFSPARPTSNGHSQVLNSSDLNSQHNPDDHLYSYYPPPNFEPSPTSASPYYEPTRPQDPPMPRTNDLQSVPVNAVSNQQPPYDHITPMDWHLHRLFSSQDFADVTVTIQPVDPTQPMHTLHLHALVLARSPRLQEMIKSVSKDPAQPTKAITLHPEAYYKSTVACVDTIRALYGYDISNINLDNFWHRYEALAGAEGPRYASVVSMEELVSCIATARFLRMDSTAQAWLSMVPKIINSDNAEVALTFALQGGLSQYWLHSSDARSKKTLEGSTGYSHTTGPTYEPYSTMLTHGVLEFFAAHMDSNFVLDVSAPALPSIDRFPAALMGSARHSREPSREQLGDPRLKSLRLGEFPVNDGHVEMMIKTIGSALLSLPFAIVKNFLEDGRLIHRLGHAAVSKLMHTVVLERERRRHAAVEASILLERSKAAHILTDGLLYDLGIIEAIEPTGGVSSAEESGHGPGLAHRNGHAAGVGAGVDGMMDRNGLTHRLICKHVPVILP